MNHGKKSFLCVRDPLHGNLELTEQGRLCPYAGLLKYGPPSERWFLREMLYTTAATQPVQEFHSDETFAILLTDFVDRADVGMV